MALVFPAPAQIKNLLDPTASTDAATKSYVDNVTSGSASANFTANNVTANSITINSNIIANTATISNLGNVVVANYFTGSGNNLSNIQASNITGTVANANYAAYAGNITISSQPNITSVGTLITLGVSGDTTLNGNLTVAGTTTYVNTTVTSIEDPVIELGGGPSSAPLTTNDGMDRGTLLHYYTTTPVSAFMGWQNSNSEFVFSSNATILNNVISVNDLGNIRSGNANLGNAVVANYFVGDGSLLTNIYAINANFANYAGNVTVASQPNITSVGTLTKLDVTGNITSGNANLGNAVKANYFVGNAYYLTGVIGNAANANFANYAGNVTLASQPNITSVGTLSGLTATSVVDFTSASNVSLGSNANVHLTGGSSGQYLQTDGTGNLSWSSVVVTTSKISNVNSNVSIPIANGNVTISSNGNANIVVVTDTGVNVAGYLTATANVTANYFIGNGSQLTGIIADSANFANYAGNVTVASQPNITSVGTLTSLKVGNATANTTFGNGTVTAITVTGNFIGDGSNLSALNGANVTGFVPNANVANTALSVSGSDVVGQVQNAIVAGTVYTASQPNIKSVGTLTSFSSNGTINFTNATNVSLGPVGNLHVTGGSSGQYLQTDGTGNLTWASFVVTTTSIISNVNSNVSIPVANGNVTISSNGNANIFTVTGTGANVAGYLDVSGNITASSVINVSNSTQATGTGTGALIVQGGASITKDLYVGGNLYVPNLISTSSTTLTVEDPLLYLSASTPYPYSYDIGFYSHFATSTGASGSNGYQHTGFIRNHSDNSWYLFSNCAVEPTGGTVYLADPNLKLDDVNVGNISAANITAGNANLGNAVTANYFIGSGNNLSNIRGGNVNGQVSNALVAGTVYTASQPNITSVGTLTSLVVTGNITSGNANLGNAVNANYFIGSGNNLSNIQGGNVSGQVGNALVAGTVYTASQPNITSVGTLSSLTVSGLLTATSTGIKVANIEDSTGTIAITTKYSGVAGDVGITGNLSVGTSGTGNVTANYFFGNGYYLTGITTTGFANFANYAGNVTVASQPNITSLGTLTSLVVSGNITSGNANLGNAVNANYISIANNANISGIANITGNVIAGNANLGNAATANYFIGSGNNLSNIQGANVSGVVANATYAVSASSAVTASTVTASAQGNITSVGTLTSLAVTGNITSGNANLGNAVNANYFIGNGSQLTSVIATSANYANYAGNVTVASQPNITSVGTLTSLAVTGNITSGNANLGNAVNANYFIGNGALLTGITTSTSITNGTSNVVVSASSNISMSVSGTSNVVVVTSTGANITGYANVSGNVTAGNANLGNAVSANYFVGNGSLLTGMAAPNAIYNGTSNVYVVNNGNAVANIAGNNTLIITSTGVNVAGYANITGNVIAGNANLGNAVNANYFIGNGSLLTGVGSPNAIYNGTSNVYVVNNGNAVANIGGNNTLVITSTGANVTGYATVSGNITAGNANLGNAVTANYFVGNGAFITGIGAPNAIYYGTSNIYVINNGNAVANIAGNNTLVITSTGVNVAGYANVSGNITAGNANLGNAVTANYFVGNGAFITGIGAPNAIYNGTSNIYVINNGNAVANIGGNNTMVLTTLGANISGYANVTGNVSANFFIGNGSLLSGISTSTSLVNGNSNIVVDSNSFIQFSANGVSNVLTLSGTFANVLTNLNVGGVSNLGNIGNVKITGGSANYVMITNGAGGLTWGPASAIYSDTFTGTGAQTTFGPLSVTPTALNQTIVNYNGVIQLRSAYSLSGANIVFTSPPAYGALIEVTTVGVTAVVGTTGGSGPTSYVQNGNSNVVVNTNSSVVISTNGVYDIVSFLDTGSYFNTAVTFNSTTNLGPPSNITISGGSAGYVLSTDGTGNLSWVAQSGGSGGGGGSGTGYSLANGTSNLFITNNSTINMSANGVANIVSFLDTGSFINSSITLTSVTNLGQVGNVKIQGGTSGYYLQTDGAGNLSWSAVTATGYNISNGNSNVTVTGNSAVNISANGVANVVSILDTASYVNSNITMTKVTTLGSNANVKITGGTNGQFLSTDGTGNLSWTTGGSGGSSASLYSDVFTGTGLQTTFGPLSVTPTTVNQTWINYNGVLQLRSSYSLSGANIVFSSPPAYGASIEITTISAGSVNVTTSQTARAMVMGLIFGG